MNWKKTLKITGITLGALLGLLLILPFAFKDKIVSAVQTAANKNLKATVSFNPDLSLSLIRNFPNLSLGINDLKIVGKDSFANDTLIDAPHLRLVVDIASVFGGNNIVIRKIHLQDARANIIFLKSGVANFDIAIADTTAPTPAPADTSAPMSLKIKELNIENTRIHYVDHSLDFELTTEGTNLLSEGDFADDIFTLNNEIGIDRASMSFAGMTLLSKAKLSGETAIDMDLNQMKFGFADNQFQINELPLIAKGWVKMGETDMDMDIDVRTPNTDFKSFLSVVPGCYTENFADVKATGSMGLVFTMKGLMNDDRMPSTHVALNVKDAGFQYPAMPANASNIQLNFALDNTDGNPDNTHIVIAPLSANLGGDNLAIALDMKTPVSNPYAKGKMDINLHLDKWKQLMPLESGTSVAGEVDAHFNFDGHYSAIAKEQYNDLQAGGNIALKNIAYTSPTTLPLKLQQLEMGVSPSDFTITVNQLQFGKSSMNINGKLQNMLGYYLNNETLQGQLIINSNRMDLNEWMAWMSTSSSAAPSPKSSETNADAEKSATAQNTQASGESNAPKIPENLDLMFNLNAGQLLYEDFDLQQATAKAWVKNGALTVDPLAASIFGARVELSALSYSYPMGGKPTVKGGFNILNVNPANLATTLSLVKEFAPIVGRIQGLANIETQMGMMLKPNMDMDLGTLTAGGLFNLFSGNLDVPSWMGEAAKQLQWGSSDKLALKPTKAGFLIENGQFKLKDSIAFGLPKEGQMKLGGFVDLNKQLHLGGTLTAKGRRLPYTITGDMKNPKFTVGWKGALKEAAAPVVNQLKDKAFDALNKEVAEILKQAKEKADLMRRNGKETADKLRAESKELAQKQRAETDKAYDFAMDKAKKESDALVAAAKDPIQKKLAKAAADKLLKEADKKANAAKAEGYKLADQTESGGNQKADQWESSVNDKADQVELAAKNRTNEMIKQAKAKADAATK
ncbi:MAG: hypothetical protein FJ333_02540 [Sphingomonadales bacterium]|nr:hypothetical protein [Sphingomonadales bacterium]